MCTAQGRLCEKKSSYLSGPNKRATFGSCLGRPNLLFVACDTPLAVVQPTLIWVWAMKRHPRTIPGPIPISTSWSQTRNLHFTSRGNHQIFSQKHPLQAVSLLLWLGARMHWCRRRKHYIFPAPLCFTNLQIILQRPPPYACITGCAAHR